MSRKIPFVEDLQEPPVVGERYRVRCVKAPLSHRRARRAGTHLLWVPVMGPLHSDPELGITAPHYHLDWRFTGPQVEGRVHYLASVISAFEGQTVARVLPCTRCQPTFPSTLCSKLEPIYRGCRIKADRPVCPHRGFSLAGLPTTPDGYVICPGHGLLWDLNTGVLINRDGALR